MQTKPTVSVIIPVFNDYPALARCLAALEAQSYPRERFDIFVIDNGSTERAPLPAMSKATLLEEPRPGSFRARNVGIAASKGEVLAFIDSDCLPARDWLENGVAALLHCKGPAYVAGRVVTVPADPEHPTPTELYEMSTAFPFDKHLKDSHYGGSGNLFVWRSIIEDVGPFDAEMQSGGDAEFGRRVFLAGYQQFFAGDAVVSHPARRTLEERLIKAYRVHAGALDLMRKGNPGAIAMYGSVTKPFLPPVRKLLNIARTDKIRGPGAKAKAMSVQLALHYGLAWEHLRTTKLGKPPRGVR